MFNILVIDDSLLMRNIAREALEEEGFTVTDLLPETVEALKERIQSAPPDLVLSDFNMPLVDGLDVARTVRQVNAKIPVIILSANRDEARDAHLKAMGVRAILYKPIKGEAIVAAVAKVLVGS
ncbi:MAG TPA: response regulator [Holophagaceae bacterium]|nr:response regulator [Holophagaceae bacterium]